MSDDLKIPKGRERKLFQRGGEGGVAVYVK